MESWQIDIRWTHADGRIERIKRRSPIQTRRGAEQYERDVRNALLSGAYGAAAAPAEVPTFEEFAPRFLTYSENNNKASTVMAKRSALATRLVPFFGKLRLDEIGPAQVEDFKAKLRATKSNSRAHRENVTRQAVRRRHGVGPQLLTPKTINNYLTMLRKMLTVAQEQGVLETVPRVKLLKTTKPPFDFLSFQEADRLLKAAEPQWRPALLLVLKAGLRIGELLGLQWADIDLVAGRLVVRRNIYRGIINTPKGGRARELPLTDSVVEALRAHRHLLGPYVFCNATGQPLKPGALKFPLDRALRKAGIARTEGQIGWHDLRHTFASHLVMHGQSLKAVQELLGHATIDMTMRYAHLSPEVKKAAVMVLDRPVTAVEVGSAQAR